MNMENIPTKEELSMKLKELDTNVELGKFYGVSDSCIIKWLRRYNLYKPRFKDWSEVVDLESLQKVIDDLGIKSLSDLNDNFGGLSDRVYRLNISRNEIIFPDHLLDFDSSWEENLYNLISDERDILSISKMRHNIQLSEDCKYVRPLIFDIVLDFNNSKKVAIEIQGPTHFKNVHDTLESVLIRDSIKYNYCINNDIEILYFTYEESLVSNYGYPHFVYTDETLLLNKLKEISLSNPI